MLRAEFQKSLAPITVFVDSMMPIHKRMADVLPPRHVCDGLLRDYIENEETLYRVIHVPTFRARYDAYWEGSVQYESFLPKLLGVLAIASNFESTPLGLGRERPREVHLPTAAALMRLWLNSLSGDRLIEINTLQVEVLWLLATRIIRENPRDGWAQMGSIIRMAVSMGLHRDPSEFGSAMTPFIGEMRRRLWATITDLDDCISCDCSLPPYLGKQFSTTGPPRNLDDADLHLDMEELPPSKPLDQVTDNQAQAYSAMTLGLRQKVSVVVGRAGAGRDWTEIFDVGSRLEQRLEHVGTLLPWGLGGGPDASGLAARAWRHRRLLEMQLRRSLLHLYQPFALGAVLDVPHRILRGCMRHSLAIVEGAGEGAHPSMGMGGREEMEGGPWRTGSTSDIVQAALGICYYIRAATGRGAEDPTAASIRQALQRPQDNSGEAHQHLPRSSEGGGAGAGAAWPTARLIGAVDKVVGSLAQRAKRGGTKDVLCLAVVLESVRAPRPRADDVTAGLRRVLESSLAATNWGAERLASTPAPLAEPLGFIGEGAGTAWASASRADDGGWMFGDGWE